MKDMKGLTFMILNKSTGLCASSYVNIKFADVSVPRLRAPRLYPSFASPTNPS